MPPQQNNSRIITTRSGARRVRHRPQNPINLHPDEPTGWSTMSQRSQAPPNAPVTSRTQGVRRNLFYRDLIRRPTTSSTSTSADTLRLDTEPERGTEDIVIRDQNGDFDVGGIGDIEEDAGDAEGDEEKEKQRLADMVKSHCRDRNRTPSEPAELLELVQASLRVKTAALAQDNWMYEAEDEPLPTS